ncbi:plasmid mobilization protein [Pseudomonas folii]|uniref:plasmid mobilization protein n=1 Tax=Pseudomonas folii TaxID=2762593 RepID=UPI001FE3CD41|nr:hypothetical protein [Pseudomonas folii]
MELSALKKQLQKQLGDGLVLVVGSGLSCADGVPGMGPLGRHLVTHIPASLSPDDNTLWQEEEKAAITEKANDAGMSPSGYLRALGLNKPIRSLVNLRAGLIRKGEWRFGGGSRRC